MNNYADEFYLGKLHIISLAVYAIGKTPEIIFDQCLLNLGNKLWTKCSYPICGTMINKKFTYYSFGCY